MAFGDDDQKTEKPTPKRREQARKRGQVAKSPDLAQWATVLAGTFLLPWVFGGATTRVVGVLGGASQVIDKPTIAGAIGVLTSGLRAVAETVIPAACAIGALGIAANVAQVGRAFSIEALTPKFSRISPRAGIKRLFSAGLAVNLAKQLAKLALLAGVAVSAISSVVHLSTTRQPVGLAPLLGATTSVILNYVRTVALLGLGIGIADFAYQRHHLTKMLMMTRQEVRDESRAAEGDPAIKGELRKRQYAIARMRMIAAVKTADLIVANPTHFSVALRYRHGDGGTPVVVAKGADEIALRIREEGERCGVPLVEDPPLARWMFTFCELDQPIPPEIYLAVAKVLAYVYSLPPAYRRSVLRPASSVVPIDPGAEAGVAFARRHRRAAVAESTRAS